jgi:probable rRNA maturation factor
MSIDVTVQDEAPTPHNPSDTQFEQWVDKALANIADAPHSGEITIKIIDEEESAVLNQTFREKDGPTNVLSFPYDNPGDFFMGDIAICANLVAKEAQDQDKSIEAHWAHLVVHGVLHLMGYDHIEESDAKTMERLEIDVLSSLGYENPY